MKIIITKKEKEFFEHLLKTAEKGENCPTVEKKIGKKLTIHAKDAY